MLLERRGKNFRTTGESKRIETSQDQILGKGHYSDPQEQARYDEHTLSLCSTTALNTWDGIQEPEKRTESYIRVKQGQREFFTDFLQRLTKAVTDPEARHVVIEFVAFENASIECKIILGPLKVRSAPLDKWIMHKINV